MSILADEPGVPRRHAAMVHTAYPGPVLQIEGHFPDVYVRMCYVRAGYAEGCGVCDDDGGVCEGCGVSCKEAVHVRAGGTDFGARPGRDGWQCGVCAVGAAMVAYLSVASASRRLGVPRSVAFAEDSIWFGEARPFAL